METFDFAARPRVAPIRSDAAIARAKRNAVGGKRKRCTKGKNCSAACIAANMVCLVDLPWVGPALGQARRFVMNRMEGSQPGKSQRVLGWEKVSNKGVAPVPAPAPPKAKKAPKAKKVAGPKGAVPPAPAAQPPGAKPKIDIDKEKAEFKKQPTDVLQGLLKYKSQLAPERIKAIESELRGRVKAKAPTAKAPAAKTPKTPAASAALREEFRQKLQAKSIEDLQGMVDRFASKIPKDRLQVIKEELAKKKAAAQGQLSPAKAPSTKPTQQSNSFYQDKNKYDFDAAMKMPASFKGIGDFGEVRLLENGQVVKEGKIGQYEAAILNKLKGKEITPELLGVQYRQSMAPTTVDAGYGGHVRERNGLLAMKQAPGLPVGAQFDMVSPAERAKMMDAYIKVRGRLHENGIAHNDMHGGNVFYDSKTGKAMLIDMGLAQMNPKAALVEAMGVFNRKDWQAEAFNIGIYDTPTINRLKDNIDKVRGELKKAGVEPAMLPGIRAKDAKLKQVLGKLTDDQAQNFVNQIYKGVISPSSVVPAPKVPTAKSAIVKAPSAKPETPTPKKIDRNSFQTAGKAFDFEKERDKSGASFHRGGAQANGGVVLHRNATVPNAIKMGEIGQYEIAAHENLKDVSAVPKVLGVRYDPKGKAKVAASLGGHVKGRAGEIAMEIAPGEPLAYLGVRVMGRQGGELRDAIADQYILARKAIHGKGVAHNDMHEGNIFYDQKTGKLAVIDFGLAQISPKAALAEALGAVPKGGDFQGEWMLRAADSPLAQKYRQNVAEVKDILKNQYGVTGIPNIRRKQQALDKGFRDLTDGEAQKLISKVYEGLPAPTPHKPGSGGATAKAPAPKSATAKAPSVKPETQAPKAPAAKPVSAKAPSAAPAAKPAAQPSVKPSARGIPDAWLKNLSKRPTADLEKLENHADQLNPQQKKLIKDELKRRKQAQGPTAYEPPKSTPGNSFRNPSKDFDFSKERAKPEGSVYKGGAQAKEDVIIHRNVSNPNAIKKGKIGQYEVAALEKLKDADIVPPVMGVRYEAGVKPTTVRAGLGGHVKEKDGELAMGIAPGLPIAKGWYAKDKKTQGQVMDEYVRAREKLHKNGVAHNDMHAGNVFYDPKTGKMTVIDLGLAQVNPKAALAEALGVFDGNDFQAKMMGVGQFKTPVIKQLRQNVEDVKTELKDKYGVAPAFLPRVRTPEAELNKIFKNLTDSEAEALIGKVYAGLPAPKAKPAAQPAAKAPVAKAPLDQKAASQKGLTEDLGRKFPRRGDNGLRHFEDKERNRGRIDAKFLDKLDDRQLNRLAREATLNPNQQEKVRQEIRKRGGDIPKEIESRGAKVKPAKEAPAVGATTKKPSAAPASKASDDWRQFPGKDDRAKIGNFVNDLVGKGINMQDALGAFGYVANKNNRKLYDPKDFDEVARRLADKAKAGAKAPAGSAPKAPAAKPEGVRTKREKMDLDEFKKDIKNEKSEELKNILWGRGRGKDMVAQAKANRDHRNALGKDKVDEIERELRRREGKPSERTPLKISEGHSGAAPKAPSAKPASAKPAAKESAAKPEPKKLNPQELQEFRNIIKHQPMEGLVNLKYQKGLKLNSQELKEIDKEIEARRAPKRGNARIAAVGDMDAYRKNLKKDPDYLLQEALRYESDLGPERLKAVKDELRQRGVNVPATAPKFDMPKFKKDLEKRGESELFNLARQKDLNSSQRVAVQGELLRRDKANRLKNIGDDELEKMAKESERKLGAENKRLIALEQQRRRAENKTPSTKPAGSAPKPAAQSAQAAKDSFLEAKKPYDFSNEEKKTGWVDLGKQGVQAENVRLNRNLPEPVAIKNGKIGQYEAAALEKLQNVSVVPNLYGVRYDSKASPQPMESRLEGSLGPHIKDQKGKLAMELKAGKPIRQVDGRKNKDQLVDDLLKARKEIHMRGVAHNDMHGGNLLYDDAKKKLNVIDFGLAQVSPKAALIEALGGWNARDYQAGSMIFKGNGPAVKQYMMNVGDVEQKLKGMGINPEKIPGIRSPLAEIEKYFGSMTDSEAQRLVAEIYKGI